METRECLEAIYRAKRKLGFWEIRQSALGSGAEVEDVYQEACLRFLQAGHKFESPNHAWTYFKVVLRSVLIDRSRKVSRYSSFRRRIGRPLPYRTNYDDEILTAEVAERFPQYYERAVAGGKDAAYYRHRLSACVEAREK